MAGEPTHQRTFQSREIIWNTFESMARELGIPIDELVNEAMAAYARARGYAVREPGLQPMGRPAATYDRAPAAARPNISGRPYGHPLGAAEERDPLKVTREAPERSALDRSYSPDHAPSDIEQDDLARTAARSALARPGEARPGTVPFGEPEETRTAPRLENPARSARPRAVGHRHAPSTPPLIREVEPYTARPPISAGPPPLPARMVPSVTVPSPGAPPHEALGAKRLILTYRGHVHEVDKDRFLIGRSKTQADLRLDDPNVSRQHAVVERVGSAWHIVDLGSTNGVTVAGERVARRALSDGDLIVITAHEIRCSLR